FLAPAEVDRLLAACPHDPAGLRDRAILLLLARLGLRASEVAGLQFGDIDWRTGRLAVCGKGRRAEWLPLPQAVGAALLRYLRRARPPWPGPTVFATVKAPWHALTRQAVSAIVVTALRRAGVEAPVHGAHLLRHSAATAMLRQGASLAGIAAVLRHRSPRTTVHYAKVDFALLAEIAQPWPGGAGC
ncbi:MAG: integrase, partial [Zetaproteobacteria bacterium]